MGVEAKYSSRQVFTYSTMHDKSWSIVREIRLKGWLAAGWPQWVAAGDDKIEDGDQFDYDINRFQSIAFFCLIGGNLIPGIFIDSMNKHLTRWAYDLPHVICII